MESNEFEELRRQFQRQFGKFSGGSVKKILGLGIAIFLIVLILFGSFSTFYTVDADEVGVVLRLGRYYATTARGLHFKLPFGVDRVTKVKVERVHKEEFGFRTLQAGARTQYSKKNFGDESHMLTADLGIADVEWIVQYRVRDPKDYLFRIRDVTNSPGRPSTLRDVSEAAMRLVVGDFSMDEVITSGRRAVALEAKERTQKLLDDYGAGIDIRAVELQDVNPPSGVRDSFNDVNRAIQEKETSINDAEKERNQKLPAARGQARQSVESARGYREQRINEAKGNAARFTAILTEYEKAKEVTRTRLYLETLEEVLPRIADIYVLDGAQNSPLQVLDLKEGAASKRSLRKRAGSGSRQTQSEGR